MHPRSKKLFDWDELFDTTSFNSKQSTQIIIGIFIINSRTIDSLNSVNDPATVIPYKIISDRGWKDIVDLILRREVCCHAKSKTYKNLNHQD